MMPDISDPKRIDLLRQTLLHLRDPQRSLLTIDLDRLSDLSRDDLSLVRDAWQDLSQARRRSLVAELVELAEDRIDLSFRRVFEWLIRDEDPWVRAQAIDGLWEEEDVRLIGPLTDILHSDSEPLVRAAAAQGLGRFVLAGELDQIEHDLAAAVERALLVAHRQAEQDTVVRQRALESLAYSASPEVADLIRRAYADEEDSMRRSAVFAMGRSADGQWREIVLSELASPDMAMRYEAARASGEMELAEAVPDLISFLDQDDVELRDTAVWALGRIGGPEARRALLACCDSADEELAEAAEEALAELNFLSGDDDMPAFMFDVT